MILIGVHRINKGVFDPHICSQIQRNNALLVGTGTAYDDRQRGHQENGADEDEAVYQHQLAEAAQHPGAAGRERLAQWRGTEDAQDHPDAGRGRPHLRDQRGLVDDPQGRCRLVLREQDAHRGTVRQRKLDGVVDDVLE